MKIFPAMGLVFVAGLTTMRADVEILWGVNGAGGAASNLYAINPANGKIVGQRATGVSGLSGVTRNPVTKVLYATSANQGTGKVLYTLNQVTGRATPIGVIGGGAGFPVADTAFRADGTLYAWRPQTNRLYTINLATAAATQLAQTPSTLGPSGITFGSNGTLYMVRNNSLITVNPNTGALAAGPSVLSGATLSVDNLFATSAAGTLYVARHKGVSALYAITTGAVTTLVANMSGVALSGMDFGTVGPPAGFKSGKSLVRVKSATATLKGTAISPLTLTVSAKGKKAAVANGRWTLKVKVPIGRRTIDLLCTDEMGQKKTAKVVVDRS